MATMLRRAARWLVSIEIWPVGLAVTISIFFPDWLPVTVGVMLVFWPLRWLANGKPSLRTPLDFSLAPMLLLVPVTLWVTAFPEKTGVQVWRLLVGMGLFYAIANWAISARRVRLLADGFVLTGLALALLSPVIVQWPTEKLQLFPADLYSRFSLLVADPANPNVMAGFLVLFLSLALGQVLFGWRALQRMERLAATTAILVILASLLLTQSRGAWMALLLVLAILTALRWRRGWIILAAIIGVALICLFLIGPQVLLGPLVGGSDIGSLNGRLEVWSRAYYMIQDFPFTGVGMGAFMDVADMLYPFFIFEPGRIEHAHNLLFQIAVDLGIPGLVAWLAAFLITLYTGWQVASIAKLRTDGWLHGVGIGLFCGQLALIIHGLWDAVTWGMVRPAPLLWAFWGLIAASGRFVLQGRSQAE